MQVSNSGFGAFEPALAVRGDELVVAWNDNRHGNDEIYLRRYDHDLRALSPELRLTDEDMASYEADVAAVGDKIAVAWYDKNAEGQLSAMLGLWNAEGEQLWQRQLSMPGRNGRVPVLKLYRDEWLFVAWIDEKTQAPSAQGLTGWNFPDISVIYGLWIDVEQNAGNPFFITQASKTTWNLNAGVLPDARVVLAFDAEAVTQSSEIYLALIDNKAAARLFVLTEDDGFPSKYPDIAHGPDGRSAITWFDDREGNNEIYLNVFDLEALLAFTGGAGEPNPKDIEKNATRITETAGDSIGAYLAWNGDTLGLAWNDDEPGQHEIFFQRFDDEGRALTPARRLTDSAPASLIPAIVPLKQGFALGWNEAVLGDSHTGGSTETKSEIVIEYVE